MKIIIRTKNLELTEELQKIVDEKIGGLKKFLTLLKENKKTLTETFVELEKETLHHKKGQIFRAEVQIQLPGKNLIAEAKGEDLEQAIVEVKDELQQEIKKYKLKIAETTRRSQRKLKKSLLAR